MAGKQPKAYKHYERIIAACGFLIMFANIGIPQTSFSVFQPYIVDMIGDSAGSLIPFTRAFAALLAMFVVDFFLLRFGIRLGVTIASLCTAAAFLIYSYATSLTLFVVAAFVSGIGYGLGGMVAMTMLLGRWFKDKVSTAVGIAAVGSGVASILLPLLSLRLISYHSLTTAFRAEALIAAGIALILFVFLRNSPADIGALPYTAPQTEKTTVKKTRRVKQTSGVYPDKRIRYALLVGMAFLGSSAFAGTAYLTVLMTSEGFDPVFAGFLFAAMGAALTISKYVAGK
ncbi:MAG: MFS transporter, partial [Actinomycetaceae bacterium]|nr:MFS transporter [Actinomycetaceae bacterium]